jgi:hypothetical protein
MDAKKRKCFDKTKMKIIYKGGCPMKKERQQYESPQVITYSEDEIIELLGPAQTCSPSPCPTYQ